MKKVGIKRPTLEAPIMNLVLLLSGRFMNKHAKIGIVGEILPVKAPK